MNPASEPVYRGMTRQALDQEYDNVKKVPGFDFKAYLASLDAGNRSARERYAPLLRPDVRFGPTEAETLDLFVTRPGGPLHVFFHGGYWRMLHKNDFTYVAHGVLPHGVNLAIVNYALIPTVRMGELVAQCERSIQFLMRNGESLGIDPRQVSVSGHSAGGHLAAMMAARGFPHALVSVCALSGIFDLAPIQQCFLNEVLSLSDQEVEEHSPVRLTPHFQGRLHLLTGEEEGVEYARQATALRDAWSAHRSAPTLEFAAGHNHFTLRAALADPASSITKAALGL
ncbi:MAG: alpha/beta hydrolase [Pigmentiphaga sp.]|nr:alpha/beta hydrolase [Pigmentiphaga sp.]